ncbi:MAG: AAA family ATPase, partial [Anaerolineae bacterium]|nr:AAA family ATPase [Anaerolineae bacterium]
MYLLKAQRLVSDENLDMTIFLEGTAGTGKTTAAVERIKTLIKNGVSPESILVLVPQAALGLPYREGLRRARGLKGANITITTLSALAVELVDLFWPLIAEESGFANPFDRPHFLSLELVQYYMTRFVEPEIRLKDYFNSVHISPNRLYTQIVDNLNKAALVGFPPDAIGRKLKSAWSGDTEQAFIYNDVQVCADLFRDICYRHNLVDFSLQIQLLTDTLWKMEAPRRYLTRRYRHLIADNLEEDTPAAHDILAGWLKECESAVLIYDTDAGYRRFLGADSTNAYALKDRCIIRVALDKQRVMSPEIEAFQIEIAHSLNHPQPAAPE